MRIAGEEKHEEVKHSAELDVGHFIIWYIWFGGMRVVQPIKHTKNLSILMLNKQMHSRLYFPLFESHCGTQQLLGWGSLER